MLKKIVKRVLIYFDYFLYKTPYLRGKIIYFIKKFPLVEIRLKRLLQRHLESQNNENNEIENFQVEIIANSLETFRFPLVNEKHLLSKKAQQVFSILTNRKGL